MKFSRVSQGIYALLLAFTVSCSTGKVSGWWLLKSVTVDGETTRLDESATYMIGFNTYFQMYNLAGKEACSGKEHSYDVSSGKITVSSKGDCVAKSADYSFEGSRLVLEDGRFSDELVFDKAVFEKITYDEVMTKYRGIPGNRGDSPDGDQYNHDDQDDDKDGPSDKVQGTSFVASDLNGFWKFYAISYKGKVYYDGDTVPGSTNKVSTQGIIHYFQNGEFIQFYSAGASTEKLLNFHVTSGRVYIPQQQTEINGSPAYFQAADFAVLSLESDIMLTGPFIYRFNGDEIREFYTKMSETDAATALQANPVYKKLFP